MISQLRALRDVPSSRFEPRARPRVPSHVRTPAIEERLVPDDRGALRPAQMVEIKLSGQLKGTFVLLSHMRLIGSIKRGLGSE